MPNFTLSFESAAFYEALGIRWFKKYLITNGDVMRKRRKLKPHRARDVEVLKKLERDTKKYETIHCLGMGAILFLVAINHEDIPPIRWLIIFLINLYANVYPIFLQRYNRIRIVRLLKSIAS